MPELTTDGLDVSAEEERYLRRAFRRFALPYVVLLMAFAWWASSGAPEEVDPEALDAVRGELAELRASVASLGEQVAQASERARVASRLAAELDARRDGASAGALAELQRELGRAASRIAALEKGAASASAAQRFDALTDRIAGVERRLDRAQRDPVPASPGPVPPPGAPPAP